MTIRLTGGVWKTIAGFIPSLGVFLLLGALGFLGHHFNWKVPKFRDVVGSTVHVQQEDWCERHGVPLSRCLACNPELGGANAADWCKEHGVPESKCVLCHPEIQTKGSADDWCKEHGLPESGCTICHPEIAVKGPEVRAADEPVVTKDPNGKAEKDPKQCLTHVLRVQFASPEAVRKAGIRKETVQERPFAIQIDALAETEYDQTRIARLASRSPGTVFRVLKEIGEPVAKGDVLALVDAAEAGQAKTELLKAHAELEVKTKLLPQLQALVGESELLADIRTRYFERVKALTQDRLQTQTDLQAAESAMLEARLLKLKAQTDVETGKAAVRDARIRLFNAQQALLNLGLPLQLDALKDLTDGQLEERLRFLGLPEALVRSLSPEVTNGNLIPLVAPLDGVVTERNVASGEVVDKDRALFTVTDVRRLWVMLDLQQEEAARIAVGQTVFFQSTANGDTAQGRIEWVDTALDDKTRTLRARAVVPNENTTLRAHLFGRARVTVREQPKAVAVPTEAIHWEGCCYVVFVRLTDDIFQTRKVKLGAREGAYTEVTAGLVAGETIATTGSNVLKSEILKSSLGAGCCD